MIAFAHELEIPMMLVKREHLFDRYVGGTEEKIAQLVRNAEANAPILLFIDEFDSIGQSRDQVMSTDSGVGRGATTAIMSYLGDRNRKAIIVATTNVIEQIDPAFLRAGRFDERIPMLYPDLEGRVEIMKVHLNVLNRIPSRQLDLEQLAKDTPYWSGAEVEDLVLTASRIALRQDAKTVMMKHFDEAFTEVQRPPTRSKEMDKFIAIARQYSSSPKLLESQLKEAAGTTQVTSRAKAAKRSKDFKPMS
jgi:cell division protease FtsH